jgi:two-component system cell cycle sensor histidine kinase/response regulator CckA
MTTIQETYDLRLVALSVVIAVVASFAALNLTGRIKASDGKSGRLWLFGGAMAMGLGIWAMHYVGMLAVEMPMPIFYHVPTVIISLFAAISASAFALFTASRPKMERWQAISGGAVMGSGIAAMHYIGMAAMRMSAQYNYSIPIVVLSVVLAIVISFVALVLTFRTRDEARTSRRKIISALIMGSAIPVMHYTGMAAARFSMSDVPPSLSLAVGVSSLGVLVIAVVTLFILSLVIVGTLLDQKFSLQRNLTQQAQGESKRNLEALFESEQRLRLVTDNARVGLVVLDKERRYVYVNQAYANILELSKDAVLGQRVADVLPTLYETQIGPRLDQAFSGQRVTYELRRSSATSESWYDVRYEPSIVNGTVSAVVVVVTDITERSRAELTSRRLAAIVEFSEDAIISKDLHSTITSWNKGAETIFGYTAQEITGKPITTLIPRDRLEEEEHILHEIKSGRSIRHFETVRSKKNGQLIDVAVTASPIRDSGGNTVGVSKIARDITDRKLAERVIKQNEERLRLFIEHAPAALAMFDRDMRYLMTSRRWRADYGLGEREMNGLLHYQIFPEVPARWKEIHRRGLAGEIVTEECDRFVRTDGTVQWVRWEVRPWYEENGTIGGIVIFSEDITMRKDAEDRLQRSQEMFTKAFRSSPLAISISTAEDGKFLDVNQAFLKMTGHERESIIGRTALDIGFWLEAEQRGQMLKTLRHRGQLSEYHLQCKTIKGEIRELESSSELIDVDGEQCILAIIRDTTEAQRLEQQYRQAQKMEAVGVLAGGVAHDFNNILGVILGYSDLILDQLAEGDRNRRHLEQIKKAGVRATSLTRQLLAFSRKQIIQPRVMDVNVVISEFSKMLLRMVGEDIELVSVLKPGVGQINADPGQIEQVIMNLVVNARDAMPHGGKLVIETAHADLDEVYCRNHSAVQPGSYVMIAVSDTGTGMSSETQSRIFEPFFTTKEQGKGTGLGLATVYGVVKQSGGHIWVYSEIGQGTTFKLYFPCVSETVQPNVATNTTGENLRGSETILLVEDADMLRELTAALLEKNGYRILAAENGSHAIQLAEETKERIDILLTDVVMPGMSGKQVADYLTAKHPDMRVLYMSGYTNDVIAHQGVLDEGIHFIEKPFAEEALMRKLREVLSGIGTPHPKSPSSPVSIRI